MKRTIAFLACLLLCSYAITTLNSGCAQIGFPTGGPKDTLAPKMVKATPAQRTTNFTGNKIVFNFNEYIDMQELQSNLLISPLQKKNPVISFSLKTITVKFKDTLLPNTTYSVDFGDAVRDLNEGNIYKNFVYTFSTGPAIDSLSLRGKLFLAETGKPDSTLMAMLYRNANDSSVRKKKPDYIARVKGDGSFVFNNLPPGKFTVFGLKDGDGGKTYNSKSETFAFMDKEVSTTETNNNLLLYAYDEVKDDKNKSTPVKSLPEKKLKYSTNQVGKQQDLLLPLVISFNNPLKTFDKEKLVLSDTNYKPLPNTTVTLDSTKKIISIGNNWKPEASYILLIPKDGFTDTIGNKLLKTDTVKFTSKRVADYGRIILRFKNLNLDKHPVLEFTDGEKVSFSYPLTSAEWSNKLFSPGEYELRILYDDNRNGVWDPGNYDKKLQPEKAITLPKKLAIKADWDNERDIVL